MDNSRNHVKVLEKRIKDLEKILGLNEKALIIYGDYMTEEAIGIIRAQNALVAIEIRDIERELGVVNE